MLEYIKTGGLYLSQGGYLFQVLHKGKHGQDCSHPMVCYINLEPTADRPAGEVWMIAESIFLKRFTVPTNWSFDVPDPKEGQWHVAHGVVFLYMRGKWVYVEGMTPYQVQGVLPGSTVI